MTQLPTPDPKALRIVDAIDKHVTAMLEELNGLHTQFEYPDEDIVTIMRARGYGHEADLYEDWIANEDPPRRLYPEGPGGYVTDPPSDSYIGLEKHLNDAKELRQAAAFQMLRDANDVPPTEPQQ
jgi:hypothetical protein